MAVDTLRRPTTESGGGANDDPLAACTAAALSPNTERAMRSDLAVYAA